MTQRDAERTREAVLRTAEDLFARQGFAETSLQQIGEAAGYARSTPAYFFRSKQELYDTVLRRVLERGREAVRPTLEAAADLSYERILDSLVGRLLEFFAGDRNYVLLMQREALAARPSLAEMLDEEELRDARRAVARVADEEDVDHVLLELVALTWFPFAHAGTIVSALGLDAGDPEFLRRHRERVVALFAARARSSGRARGGSRSPSGA